MLRDLVEEKVSPPIVKGFTINNNDAYTNTQIVTLTSDAEDALFMRFSNDSITWSSWMTYSAVYDSPGWDLGTGDGTHYVYAQFKDEGEHISSLNDSIDLDTAPPATPVVSGTPFVNILRPAWNWNSIPDASYYEWSWDNATWTDNGLSTSFTPGFDLSETSYTLYVRAIDNVGNVSTPSGSFTITVDLTPPSAPAPGAASPTSNTKPTWSWTAVSGASQYRWSYDDSTWTNIGNVFSYTPSVSLIPGYNWLYLQAGDAAGNWSTSGGSVVEITVAPTKIYWSEGSKIRRSNIDGSGAVDWYVGTGTIGKFIAAGSHIYFVENNKIYQKAMSDGMGSTKTEKCSSAATIEGIAVDGLNNYLYWTEDNGSGNPANCIKRCNLIDGSGVTTLKDGLDEPQSICLNLSANKLYYVEWMNQEIWEVNTDGTGLSVLHSYSCRRANDLKLDLGRGKLNWPDVNNNFLLRGNVDGSGGNYETTANCGDFVSPTGMALDLDAGYMYWIENSTNKIRKALIDSPFTIMPDVLILTATPGDFIALGN
ncbi:MAG: DUF5050 domain-containing protein [Spirochaetales bacterium]|nr:DUF5050 domain-containing protein [Spirochaetales bacterium]